MVDYFNIKNDFDVFEINILEDFELILIIEFDLRSMYGSNILFIECNNKILVFNKDFILRLLDEIFIFGRKKDLLKVISIFNK